MLHNKCRSFQLYPGHPQTKSRSSSIKGPWCYIRVTKKEFGSKECFKPCKGQPREERTDAGKSQYGERQVQMNYNDMLIENIQKFYKSYTWGDTSYYRWVG
ncbi:hypothetical protein OSTOST_17777, partial [Ostertagia ostertagi]